VANGSEMLEVSVKIADETKEDETVTSKETLESGLTHSWKLDGRCVAFWTDTIYITPFYTYRTRSPRRRTKVDEFKFTAEDAFGPQQTDNRKVFECIRAGKNSTLSLKATLHGLSSVRREPSAKLGLFVTIQRLRF